MWDKETEWTLSHVAKFYDSRKVGDVGPLGFRRSSDLQTLLKCMKTLVEKGLLSPEATFLDMGCGDGRVNVFMSYLVKASVGVEMDEWTLDEYQPLKKQLDQYLESAGIRLPSQNIHLFYGDASDELLHERIETHIGFGFRDFDFFYTYLVMHEEFSRLIAEKAKPGAIFMVYGVNKVLPRYDGLKLMEDLSPMEGILALYRKEEA